MSHLGRCTRSGTGEPLHAIHLPSGRSPAGRRAADSEPGRTQRGSRRRAMAARRGSEGRKGTGRSRRAPAASASADVVRDERDRLRAIVDAAADGIIAIDEAGTILEVNPAAEAIFGYRADEVLGQNVKVLMPPPFRDEHDDYVERYLRTGERRIIGIGREVRGRRKDGSIFPHLLVVAEGTVGGRRVFTGIVRDLGRLRDAEERARQMEQLAALSTITAGIAHDVGTPMTTILGYAEMLERSATDEKSRDRARLIVDQVRRVTDLLQTLLNIARPRRAEPEVVSVADVLDHSVDFFREKLKGRGIVVERHYRTRPVVIADRDRLEQVFLNLIVNAADAMPQGGTLSVLIQSPSAEVVEIAVEDTGVGIEPRDLERIFDAFYTTKERGKGTGLGLLVSQRIVHEHGGTLRVQTDVGRGTRFTIVLPNADASDSAPIQGDGRAAKPSGQSGRARGPAAGC
ncbi:MAG: PAS domain S-box protein [Myxococcota bacterium]